MPKISVAIRGWRFYLWSGAWSIYDRNGTTYKLFSTTPCICHPFVLYVGPFGLEKEAS